MKAEDRSMQTFSLGCLLLVAAVAADVAPVTNDSQLPVYVEQRLTVQLLSNYQTSVAPITNRSEPVQVSFGLSLINILELNQARETLDMKVFVQRSWHDVRLEWTMEDYHNISIIRLPADRVWRPDIIAYDGVDTQADSETGPHAQVVTTSSGHVMWYTNERLLMSCDVNLRNFPFDQQTCTMFFGSWNYDDSKINITLWGANSSTAFDIQHLKSVNREWTLLSHNAEVRYKRYDCCAQAFPEFVVTLSLKRNPLYYVHVFLVPALLVGLLVPFHMLLPPDSSERMTLGSILMASILLLILKLQDALPNTHSQLPAIGIFYTLSLLWSCLAMVSSILVFNLHSRGPRRSKVPDTIRWIFLRSLKRLVCLGSDTYYLLNDLETISMRGLDQPKTSSTSAPDRRDQAGSNPDPRAASLSNANAKLEREVEELNRQMHVLGARAHVQDSRAENVNEWRLVALVVDRVLFFVFSFVYLMCAVILLA